MKTHTSKFALTTGLAAALGVSGCSGSAPMQMAHPSTVRDDVITPVLSSSAKDIKFPGLPRDIEISEVIITARTLTGQGMPIGNAKPCWFDGIVPRVSYYHPSGVGGSVDMPNCGPSQPGSNTVPVDASSEWYAASELYKKKLGAEGLRLPSSNYASRNGYRLEAVFRITEQPETDWRTNSLSARAIWETRIYDACSVLVHFSRSVGEAMIADTNSYMRSRKGFAESSSFKVLESRPSTCRGNPVYLLQEGLIRARLLQGPPDAKMGKYTGAALALYRDLRHQGRIGTIHEVEAYINRDL